MRALASFRSLDLRLSYIPPVSFFYWSIDVGGTLAFSCFSVHMRLSSLKRRVRRKAKQERKQRRTFSSWKTFVNSIEQK